MEITVEYIVMLSVGIVICVIGLLNINGVLNTANSYSRRKLTEENAAKYGKVVGIGTLIIGLAFVLAFFAAFLSVRLVDYISIPGVAIGLAVMLYGRIKYNRKDS